VLALVAELPRLLFLTPKSNELRRLSLILVLLLLLLLLLLSPPPREEDRVNVRLLLLVEGTALGERPLIFRSMLFVVSCMFSRDLS
jgi:hypothetical protein